jgi:hypothetical protein
MSLKSKTLNLFYTLLTYIYNELRGVNLPSSVLKPVLADTSALGLTQPSIQWVPEALSLRVKRPGFEADHSLSSSVEVKNAWSYTSTFTSSWRYA